VNILAYQLSAAVTRGPYADLDAFTSFATRCPFTGSVERALWSGFHADRLGYAFAAGYGSALARLFAHASRAQMSASTPSQRSERPLAARTCLCATEAGGGHPRAIATRLDKRGGALILEGEKTFATLATHSDELLVVASRGIEADGKNRLRVVRVRPDAPGVTMTAREPTPFAPEIPHAVVRFSGVVIEPADMLPGDGYDHWLKPFRTIEDTHVLAATVGYLLGAARANGFSRAAQAELTSLALSLVDVGARDPLHALTHVVLAGLFASAKRTIAALAPEWERAPEDERARWNRDLPLLGIAEGVRAKRTEAAFAAFAAARSAV